MELFNPFVTYYRDDVDYNYQDRLNEIDYLIARNHTISRFSDGEIDFEHLLDYLESESIEPEAYMESVADEIE